MRKLILITAVAFMANGLCAQMTITFDTVRPVPDPIDPCNGSVHAIVTPPPGPNTTFAWSNGNHGSFLFDVCFDDIFCVTVTDPDLCALQQPCQTSSCIDFRPPVCNIGTTQIKSDFNGNSIAAGRYIWFNSVLKVNGIGQVLDTIRFVGQTITIGSGTPVNVPDAMVIIDPSGAVASTTFNGTLWLSNFPKKTSGNNFLSGMAYQVPAGGLPGGIKPVSWSGNFISSQPGVTVEWQWAAAVYTSFSSNLASLGIKPCDDNHASSFQNSDHAGTPENYKNFVTGGARGGGGSNYSGSYSSTARVLPCVALSTPHISAKTEIPETENNPAFVDLKTAVYPNPFSNLLHVSVESTGTEPNQISVYDITGRLIFETKNYARELEIDLKDRSKGVYLVRVINSKMNETIKVMKGSY